MFVGHYSVAFAVRTDKIPLWVLFVAVQFLDYIWATLVLLGIEKLRVIKGFTAGSMLDSYFHPYSHSLIAAVLWSGVAGLCYKLLCRWCGYGYTKSAALVVGVAVFSHWILDLIAHPHDLPIYDNTAKVGFGLWNYRELEFAVEIVLLALGIVLYLSRICTTRIVRLLAVPSRAEHQGKSARRGLLVAVEEQVALPALELVGLSGPAGWRHGRAGRVPGDPCHGLGAASRAALLGCGGKFVVHGGSSPPEGASSPQAVPLGAGSFPRVARRHYRLAVHGWQAAPAAEQRRRISGDLRASWTPAALTAVRRRERACWAQGRFPLSFTTKLQRPNLKSRGSSWLGGE